MGTLEGKVALVTGAAMGIDEDGGRETVMPPLADYSDDVWDRTIAVMLTGVYLCMKAEFPLGVALPVDGGYVIP